jgi:two-component system, LytTR family, response regulator LytT
MNVLIIEDEAPAYRRLIKLIQECDRTANIVGVVQSVKSGLEWFASNPKPDLIFSDIQLADDLSFKIFTELSIQTPVIFTTAFDEYAIKAFKFHSVDYLLKPIKIEELQQSLEKYKTLNKRQSFNEFELFLKQFIEKDYRTRFLVYTGDSLVPVSSDNVAYIISEDGASVLVSLTKKRFLISESLDQLEKELNPKEFFRANRQFIVSIKAIDKIHNYGQQKLKLTLKPATNQEIIISKLKATSFKNWLNI